MQINVSTTPQMYDLIHGKVESGMHSNANRVVRNSIRVMDQKQQDAEVWKQLGTLLTDTEASGRSNLSVDDIANDIIKNNS